MERTAAFVKYFVATGLGTGLSPFAPGTVGSLLAILLVVLFFPASFFWQITTAAALTALAIYTAGWLAEAEGEEDPSKVVIDEIAGQWIAFIAFPGELGLGALALGFFAFRAFDIWKPWPANRLETLPGGYGVVLDDVMAGIYANLFLQICFRLIF